MNMIKIFRCPCNIPCNVFISIRKHILMIIVTKFRRKMTIKNIGVIIIIICDNYVSAIIVTSNKCDYMYTNFYICNNIFSRILTICIIGARIYLSRIVRNIMKYKTKVIKKRMIR